VTARQRQAPGIFWGESRNAWRLRRAVLAVLVSAASLAGVAPAAAAVGAAPPVPALRLPYGLSVANRAALAGHGNLAFISQGKLLVIAGGSGKIRDLGEVAGLNSIGPQFSPDGKWLAYDLGTGSEWLARADGTGPHQVAREGMPQWLPGNLLKIGNAVWSISSMGALRPEGSAPTLTTWSADGKEYVYLETGPTTRRGTTSTTPWRLEVSTSLDGPRSTWYRTVITVGPSGASGNYITNVFVIPDHRGLLIEMDPGLSDDADGSPMYELSSPGAPLVKLATMLGPQAGGTVTFGPNGSFALGAGANRYAWMTKSVLLCHATSERCAPVAVPKGVLSLDPAWSPSGQALAFVEAPSSNIGSFFPNTVTRWYATHHLFLVDSATSQPVQLAGTQGASVPVWSRDGRSLLYVSGDGLWLLSTPGAKPVEVAASLFAAPWPTYYGQVDWSDEYAWSSVQS
jgi:hypothetical protein